MAFSDYNESASLNTSIGGKYTGENMQRGDVDAVLRQLAADGKSLINAFQDKFRERISVKDFDAVGDGVANDTAALNAAFARGGRVFVPRGEYLHDMLDDFPDSLIIEGEGMWFSTNAKSVLKFSGTGTHAIKTTGRNVICNIRIEGPGNTSYVGATGIGIHAHGGYNNFKNVMIRGFAEAMRIDSANNCKYTRLNIDYSIRGITLNSAIENTTQTFDSCNIRMCQKEGFKADVAPFRNVTFTFIGGSIEENAQDATTPQFVSGPMSQLNFIGTHFEHASNTRDTLNVTGAGNINVIGCYFKSANRHIFATDAVSYSNIQGSRFLDTTGTNAVEFITLPNINTYAWANESDKPIAIIGSTSSVLSGAIADLKVDEGSWTPALAGTSGGAPTHSAQIGRYTRIGNRVFFDCRVSITAKGTMSGSLRLTGLPATRSSVPGMDVSLAVSYDGLTFTGGRTDLVAVIPSGASEITFLQQGSGLGQLEQNVDNTAAATTIEISGSYAV